MNYQDKRLFMNKANKRILLTTIMDKLTIIENQMSTQIDKFSSEELHNIKEQLIKMDNIIDECLIYRAKNS